jgi:hypothetical protein
VIADIDRLFFRFALPGYCACAAVAASAKTPARISYFISNPSPLVFMGGYNHGEMGSPTSCVAGLWVRILKTALPGQWFKFHLKKGKSIGISRELTGHPFKQTSVNIQRISLKANRKGAGPEPG